MIIGWVTLEFLAQLGSLSRCLFLPDSVMKVYCLGLSPHALILTSAVPWQEAVCCVLSTYGSLCALASLCRPLRLPVVVLRPRPPRVCPAWQASASALSSGPGAGRCWWCCSVPEVGLGPCVLLSVLDPDFGKPSQALGQAHELRSPPGFPSRLSRDSRCAFPSRGSGRLLCRGFRGQAMARKWPFHGWRFPQFPPEVCWPHESRGPAGLRALPSLLGCTRSHVLSSACPLQVLADGSAGLLSSGRGKGQRGSPALCLLIAPIPSGPPLLCAEFGALELAVEGKAPLPFWLQGKAGCAQVMVLCGCCCCWASLACWTPGSLWEVAARA